MKGKKHVNAFLATTVFASVVPQTNTVDAQNEVKYTDIADSYAKNEIEYLTKAGKLYGMPNNLFEPHRETTREEFAAILARLMDLQPKASGTKFDDVSPWAEGVVGALEDKNIIAGYDDYRFGAKDTLTREQMAVFFIRAMGYEDDAVKLNIPLKYDDLSDFSDWSKPIVSFATEIGLLVGFPDGKYYPKKQTLRQDLAAVGYRFWSPEADKNPYIEKAEELIKKYAQELTIEGANITPANEKEYKVSGYTKPNQEVQVTVYHSGDEGAGITKNVIADENGYYEATFDVSGFPEGEVKISAQTWNKGEEKPEKVEKEVQKSNNATGEVNEIVGNPRALALQVGEEAKIKFTAKKADGKTANNIELKIQVKTKQTGIETVIEEKIVKTNDKGEVEFKYTSIDERTDTITAIAVKEPTLRTQNPTTVNWSIAEKGLVTVTPMDDVNKGEGILREYTATYKDSAGKAIPAGQKVYVYLGEQASSTTIVGGDFTKTSNPKYAEATITKDNGQVTLTVTDKAGKLISPLFYFDKDGDNADFIIEGNDPRAQAGTIKFMKQVPIIVLRDDGNTKVSVGGTKEIRMVVTDQYGDPYLGAINVGVKESIDNVNATLSGNIGYEYTANVKAPFVFGGAASGGQANPTTINMKDLYDNGVKNGEVIIKVKDGSSGDVGHIIAFEDKSGNGLDEADYKVEKKVEFYQNKIKSVHIVGPQQVAVGATAEYELTFKDETGADVDFNDDLGSNLVLQVLDKNGNVIENLSATAHDLDLKANATSTTNFVDGTKGTGYLEYTPTATDNIRKALVRLVGDTEGSYTIRAFIDEKVGTNNPNRKYDQDESKGEAKLEIQKQILTSARMQVRYEFALGNESRQMRYVLRDQSNKDMNADENKEVEFEAFNDGNAIARLTLPDGRIITMQPGEKKTFTGMIAQGKPDYAFDAQVEASTGTINLQVTGKVKGREDTKTTGDILWVNVTENIGEIKNSPIDRIHEGEVIAYKEGNTAGILNWYVIKAGDRYYKIDYHTSTTLPAGTTEQFVVDNNTDVGGKLFEKTLTQGDLIKVEFDKAAGTVKHILSNK